MISRNAAKPSISVIIPVYNVEPYLRKCIDSVLNQHFADFELLLVDDGSTDNSGEICDIYAQKDSRVRVFHTSNQGVSAARNLGMDKATADWVCFVDGDDWVENDYLAAFWRCPLDKDRLLIQKIIVDSDKRKDGKITNIGVYLDVDAENKLLFYPHMLYEGGGPWGKLYNLNLIKEYDLRFVENLSKCEDQIFLWSYLCYIKKVELLSSVNYHYIQRNNDSLVRKFHSSEEYIVAFKELRMRLEMLKLNFLSNIEDDVFWKQTYMCILKPLLDAGKNVNKDNYEKVFEYVRGEKKLFSKYFIPDNKKQLLYHDLILGKLLPDRWLFLILKLAQLVRKIKKC